MAQQLEMFRPQGQDAVARYLHLTRNVMPGLARARGWPVVHDHCFQRIVLDNVAGGVWYDRIARPAHRNLTAAQAATALALCEAIIAGRADLHQLNAASLRWRGKARRP
ncbi:MAG: hypothetical protein AAFY65_11905 [Pseudomonadota bacterium]